MLTLDNGQVYRAPRDARGYRLPTMRHRADRSPADQPTNDAELRGLYASCQCPCGCDYPARSFAPDWSERPDLCGSCQPPSEDCDHNRPLTARERAVLALPVKRSATMRQPWTRTPPPCPECGVPADDGAGHDCEATR